MMCRGALAGGVALGWLAQGRCAVAVGSGMVRSGMRAPGAILGRWTVMLGVFMLACAAAVSLARLAFGMELSITTSGRSSGGESGHVGWTGSGSGVSCCWGVGAGGGGAVVASVVFMGGLGLSVPRVMGMVRAGESRDGADM